MPRAVKQLVVFRAGRSEYRAALIGAVAAECYNAPTAYD